MWVIKKCVRVNVCVYQTKCCVSIQFYWCFNFNKGFSNWNLGLSLITEHLLPNCSFVTGFLLLFAFGCHFRCCCLSNQRIFSGCKCVYTSVLLLWSYFFDIQSRWFIHQTSNQRRRRRRRKRRRRRAKQRFVIQALRRTAAWIYFESAELLIPNKSHNFDDKFLISYCHCAGAAGCLYSIEDHN